MMYTIVYLPYTLCSILYTLYPILYTLCIYTKSPKITHLYKRYVLLSFLAQSNPSLSLSLSLVFPTPRSSYLTSKLQILLNCVRAVVRFRLAASSVCWVSSLLVVLVEEEEEGR